MQETATENKCGAKTRAGTPCERLPAIGRTRCRLHGGASPIGIGHPRFKHGAYSRDGVMGPMERQRRKRERERKAVSRVIYKAASEVEQRYEALLAADALRRSLRRRGRPPKVPTFDEFCYSYIHRQVRHYQEARRRRFLATSLAQARQVKTGQAKNELHKTA